MNILKKQPGSLFIQYIFISFGLMFSNIVFSQAKRLITAEDYLNARGEVYFRFDKHQNDIEFLSNTISIDRIKADTVYAYTNAKGFKSFLKLNLKYEILVPPSLQTTEEKLKSTHTTGNWNFYPTYDEYLSIMDSFTVKYPSIAKLYEIGTSVQGRKLLYLKISDNVSQKEAEPEFLYTSTIHGDEVTGYVLLLHLIDYLLSNYGQDTLVTSMINNVEIWVNPLSNPDGTFKTGNSTVAGATRFNANNIDLNRNYPDPQTGQHPDGEEWQPETIASMNFMKSHNFVFSANYHGGSEVLNYPWDTWSRLHPDDSWFQYVSKQYADTVKKYGGSDYFSDITNEGYTNGYSWYSIHGGRQDYMTYFMNGREITIEVSIPKIPSESELQAYWTKNYEAMLVYIEQCLWGIRGIATDSVTGAPLKSKVEVVEHDADNSFVYSSPANGDYHRMIYPGNYNLKFSSPGYFDRIINNVMVENFNQICTLNVKLVPTINSIDTENILLHAIPNPFNLNLELQMSLPSDGSIEITIYDIAGKQVYRSGNIIIHAGIIPYNISSKYFDKGIYFCKISFNGLLQKTIKLVKL